MNRSYYIYVCNCLLWNVWIVKSENTTATKHVVYVCYLASVRLFKSNAITVNRLYF